MAAANFDRAISLVLAHEGGYVDHPRDPGGSTNLGITIGTLSDWRGRPVSKADVKALTVSEAKAIYRRNYWDKVRGDDLPAGVDHCTFDAAVNSGPSRGAKWLQQTLGVAMDGAIGPQTIAAAAKASPQAVIQRMCDIRLGFLRGLDGWPTFGKGWAVRVERIRAEAVGMVRAPAAPPLPDVEPIPTPPKQVPAATSGAPIIVIIAIAVVAAAIFFFVVRS